jgi:hypothetical protein
VLRLPDGTEPVSIDVDGAPVPWTRYHEQGIAYARVVLPHAGSSTLEARFLVSPI